MQIKAVIRDDISAPFFDAAADGRLVVQRCASCGEAQFVSIGAAGALGRCRACGSLELDWVDAAPHGTLVSFIAVHGRPAADGAVPPPTVGGIVELDAGPWIYLTIDADPAALAVGQAMTIRFAQPDSSESVPYAKPEGAAP